MSDSRPSDQLCRTTRGGRGFSVLDLMIALAILGIVLGLAVPAYERYVQRAHRSEAIRSLLAAAACQEKVRARTGYYDTSQCLTSFQGGRYALRIEPEAAPKVLDYLLVAVPQGPQARDPCGELSLDQSGTRGSAAEQAVQKCWGGH